MWTTYEWDIETIERQTDGDEEVLDHYHAERLKDYPKGALIAENEPYEYNMLVLVRDSDGGGFAVHRVWAYVDMTTLELPEFFDDAWQTETSVKVPQRFHTEIARWRKLGRK